MVPANPTPCRQWAGKHCGTLRPRGITVVVSGLQTAHRHTRTPRCTHSCSNWQTHAVECHTLLLRYTGGCVCVYECVFSVHCLCREWGTGVHDRGVRQLASAHMLTVPVGTRQTTAAAVCESVDAAERLSFTHGTALQIHCRAESGGRHARTDWGSGRMTGCMWMRRADKTSMSNTTLVCRRSERATG